MKLGIAIKIDVKKIEKDRLFKGQKGTYLDLTTFINLDEKDKYGNHGFISQSLSKQEREDGEKTPILGNCQVFYTEGIDDGEGREPPEPEQQPEDDIPF